MITIYNAILVLIINLFHPLKGNNKRINLLPLVLVAILLGIRCYNNDWCQYYTIYHQAEIGSYTLLRENLEYLWMAFVHFFSFFKVPSYLYFSFLFFFQLCIFYKTIKENFPFIAIIVTVIYLLGEVDLSTNIIRHWFAVLIYTYSFKYIYEKKLLKYLICALIASGFHKSTFIFLPFYWVLNKDIKNIPLQLSFILVAYLFGSTILYNLINVVLPNLPVGYFDYYRVNAGSIEIYENKVNSGFGILLIFITNVIAVLLSNKMKEYYKNTSFNVFYNAFFIGSIIYLSLAFSGDIHRLCGQIYFISYPIIWSLTIYYLYANKYINKFYMPIIYILIICISLPFIYSIFTNKDDLIFFWNMEENLKFMYNLKNHL